ncbi:hypothetical protein Ssi02_17580 [Sinosporangium siamense]|uniref:Uncharacterized protein n=1 Tax=Sinosporangium siamense TaxID=1367973 RepID=A0A919RDP5_9ACTN|nr:hypothetical protein Ssi02_17580 [Sinosporangium siamense]
MAAYSSKSSANASGLVSDSRMRWLSLTPAAGGAVMGGTKAWEPTFPQGHVAMYCHSPRFEFTAVQGKDCPVVTRVTWPVRQSRHKV